MGVLFLQIEFFQRNHSYFKCLILDRLCVFINRDYLKILLWVLPKCEPLIRGILIKLFSSACLTTRLLRSQEPDFESTIYLKDIVSSVPDHS